jgi:hypothetical protein
MQARIEVPGESDELTKESRWRRYGSHWLVTFLQAGRTISLRRNNAGRGSDMVFISDGRTEFNAAFSESGGAAANLSGIWRHAAAVRSECVVVGIPNPVFPIE